VDGPGNLNCFRFYETEEEINYSVERRPFGEMQE
jgi:hypothetical protein